MPPELWKHRLRVSLRTLKSGSQGKLGERDTEILQSRRCDPTRKIQEWCWSAGWWGTTPDNISWPGSTRPPRHRRQRSPLSLSILSLRWPSAPGIAAMWAWLHSTISVCSATWHWEAGIRWLHYCKWLAAVTHTNTRTHACALRMQGLHTHARHKWAEWKISSIYLELRNHSHQRIVIGHSYQSLSLSAGNQITQSD